MPYSRLKDLIKAIRSCKTAADERALIAKESASIRTAFKDDNNDNRYISVAKLLYIHMLGYPAHFGQIECVKLVSSPRFAMKRLGYLGIMMLLDESTDVLTLVTNSLKNDMNHSNMYIVGLALCTLGNITSVEMARDLSGEVERLLGSSNSYIKKKAALCALRIIRKVPEMYENFVGRCRTLLNERNHGVLLTGIALIADMCKISPECLQEYRKATPTIVRHLKSLLSGGNSSEHDVGGVADPFLQVKILRLLRVLGNGDPESSEQMNDIIAQVATNTDGSKNVGNAILYETVLTIFDIQADNSLRVMAVNILGKFLTQKDNNIRYVALNTLVKTIDIDNASVQRHRNTIIECLRDPDISIRRRAMDLALALINENTVRVVVRELLLFLEVADEEFKPSLVTRICTAADKFAPNKKWYVDTVLRVLTIAGAVAKDEIISNLIKVVSQSTDLQPYVTSKFFQSLQGGTNQEGLIHAGIWCIGEFGNSLLQGGKFEEEDMSKYSEQEVLDLLNKYIQSSLTSMKSKEYLINAFVKLSVKYTNYSSQIQQLISFYQASIDVELQQRAVEYFNLFNFPAAHKSALEKMPPAPNTEKGPKIKDSGASQTQQKTAKTATDLLADLESMALGGGGASAGSHGQNAAVAPSSNINALADIFGSVAAPVVQPVKQPAPVNNVLAFDKGGFKIFFSQPVPDTTAAEGGQVSVETYFFNHHPSTAITDLLFQAAVPKSMKLQMLPPSSTTVPAAGNSGQPITQTLKISNPSNVPIKLRLKISFNFGGQAVTEMADFAGFP